MKNSHIEWTDHTFNPWEGCTKVSPGCANCYAEARNQRFAAGANWGPGAPRRRTSAENWKQPLRWNAEADEDTGDSGLPSALGHRRPRVFCASLADWLDDEVPIEWLADLLRLIYETPNLDWLLLTKRPENWRDRVDAAWNWLVDHDEDAEALRIWVISWLRRTPPANVWIGTTVEDQQRADERMPHLLRIPANIRFLSCEPLLGQVNLAKAGAIWSDMNDQPIDGRGLKQHIHWVICGGESGPKARPMHPDWARSLRDQCATAGVPFFFKQWGEWLPTSMMWKGSVLLAPNGKTYPNDDEHPDLKRDYPFRDGRAILKPMTRVGKAEAGRLLAGLVHNEFPQP